MIQLTIWLSSVCNKRNTLGSTSVAEIAYLSVAQGSLLDLMFDACSSINGFLCYIGRPLFVLVSFWSIECSVHLRFMAFLVSLIFFHFDNWIISKLNEARVAQWVRSLDLTAHTGLSPIRCGFVTSFVNYKKGCTRFAAANDKVYQLLVQGRWFSPGTPASSTTKTGRHDIADRLLKVAVKHAELKTVGDHFCSTLKYWLYIVLYVHHSIRKTWIFH